MQVWILTYSDDGEETLFGAYAAKGGARNDIEAWVRQHVGDRAAGDRALDAAFADDSSPVHISGGRAWIRLAPTPLRS